MGGEGRCRLGRRQARAAEAVAARRLAWSLPLGMMHCLDTGGAFRGRRRSRTEALPRAAFCDRAPHLRCSLSRSRRPFLRMMPWPARQRVRWRCTLLGKSRPFACHGFSARALACSTEPSRGTAQPGHRPLDRLACWSGQAGPSPALPRVRVRLSMLLYSVHSGTETAIIAGRT